MTPKAVTTNISQDQLIKLVNSYLQRLVGDIHELKIPDFGSSLFNDSGNFSYDANTIIAATIADRISGKFEKPDLSTESLLKRACSEDWVKYENGKLRDLTYSTVSRADLGKFYKAAELISDWTVDFWKHLENAPIDFGPGESFISNSGDTSSFSKLNQLSLWTCTIESAPLAALLIASNTGLRKILIEKFFKPKKYQGKARNHFKAKSLPLTFKKGISKKVGYFADRVLNEFLYEFPIEDDRCLVKRGSRLSSVYKNKEKRRVINVECFLNVILQKIIGYSLRQCLKAYGVDNCLDTGQERHRRMIESKLYSTLDESNASDSILTWVVKLLFKPRIFNLIDTVRSQMVLVPYYGSGMESKQMWRSWTPVRKLSSMGNGFTFEVLTMVLLALTRVIDHESSVYGDDIICASDKANDIVSLIRAAGFDLNPKKSFIDKPLRESCGAFFLDGYGNITCYDIKWCHNINDVYQTINKLGRILRRNNAWDHPLKDLIGRYHSEMMSLPITRLTGPVVTVADFPQWIESDNNYLKLHRRNPKTKKLWDRHSDVVEKLCDFWQYNLEDWTIIPSIAAKPNIKVRKQFKNVRNVSLMYSYIKDARVSDMVSKVQKQDLQYINTILLVHKTGLSIRASTARKLVTSLV